ncbi:MAG TPA: MipA/OmpV family protein [Gammaproteobacteria bacterium]
MSNRNRFLAAAAVALAAAPFTARGDEAAEADRESRWEIGVAFGYGERTNPLIQSDDIDILVDIDVAWFGKRWFFDNGDVGYTLRDAERFTLNLIGRINSDRVFFSKTDTKNVSIFSFGAATVAPIEVPDRDYAFEAGAELLTDGDWGYLQLAAHHDVSDRHHGYELYANYGRPVRRGRWHFEPSFGFAWKSADLNDYYWGVRPEEAGVFLPEYHAGAGFNTHARFVASYMLDRHWTLLLAADHERLSSEAAASPLVADRTVRSGFAGISYRF